jgi:hypothetical protein
MHTMSTIRWLLLARRMGERNFKTNGNVFFRFDGAGTVTRLNVHSPPMRMRVVEVDKFETENVLGVDTSTLSPNRQSDRILQRMAAQLNFLNPSL